MNGKKNELEDTPLTFSGVNNQMKDYKSTLYYGGMDNSNSNGNGSGSGGGDNSNGNHNHNLTNNSDNDNDSHNEDTFDEYSEFGNLLRPNKMTSKSDRAYLLINSDNREEEDGVLAVQQKYKINMEGVYFGVRLSSILFFASLFVIIKGKDGKPWPQGGWVVITAIMVCWFPSMDTASVIEKSIQRCMGTIFGGCLGLLLGYLCYKIPHMKLRVICLELCFLLGIFSVCFFSVQLKLSRTTTIVSRYSYATSLSLLTYSIAIFPFIEMEHPWNKAVMRVLNVIIGSLIGTIGSIVVLPRSTAFLMNQQIVKQCQLAGEASEAVLHVAADVFSGNMKPLPFSAELREDGRTKRRRLRNSMLRRSFRRVNRGIIEEGSDVALEKYETAIKEWRASKSLFTLLAYDPFQYFNPSRDEFKSNCALILGRSLRVQTTVVLMDGIIRNDPSHFFDEDTLAIFTEMGTLIRKMLTNAVLRSKEGRKAEEAGEAAKDLLVERLAVIENLTAQMAHVVTDTQPIVISRGTGQTMKQSSSQRRKSIICDDGNNRHALLFLQLVEHLAFRTVALYDACMEAEYLQQKYQNVQKEIGSEKTALAKIV